MQLITTKTFEIACKIYGNKDSERLALILPGRLDTKDYHCFEQHATKIEKLGYYVVVFDPPGTWESPGGIELFTTTNYIRATNELIEYFGNRPTLLVGHSRGGATASLVAVTNKNVIGIITLMESFGPPSPPKKDELEGNYYIDYRDLPPGNIKTKEQRKFVVPLTYFEDGGKYDDAEALKAFDKPKLIVYAKNDEFNTTEDVMYAYNGLLEPKKLVEIDCTHDYRYSQKAVDTANEEILSFIQEYL